MPSARVLVPRPLTSSARRLGDTAVITLTGTLDPTAPVVSGASVESTLAEVEAVLRRRPRLLVADLARVELTHFVVGLLGLLRRRTWRAGVPFVLTGVSPAAEEVLRRTRVAALYPAYPTLGSALAHLDGVGVTA